MNDIEEAIARSDVFRDCGSQRFSLGRRSGALTGVGSKLADGPRFDLQGGEKEVRESLVTETGWDFPLNGLF